MGFMSGFFRGFINSIIFSLLFSLVGISLFVGDFPPSMSQVKKVYGEYKNLIQLKDRLIAQNNNLPTADLVAVLEQGKEKQLRKLASSRGASEPVAVEVPETPPPTQADIPKEWQEQFYNLRAEVFRLNQRVQELENRKTR